MLDLYLDINDFIKKSILSDVGLDPKPISKDDIDNYESSDDVKTVADRFPFPPDTKISDLLEPNTVYEGKRVNTTYISFDKIFKSRFNHKLFNTFFKMIKEHAVYSGKTTLNPQDKLQLDSEYLNLKSKYVLVLNYKSERHFSKQIKSECKQDINYEYRFSFSKKFQLYDQDDNMILTDMLCDYSAVSEDEILVINKDFLDICYVEEEHPFMSDCESNDDQEIIRASIELFIKVKDTQQAIRMFELDC